MKTTILLDHEPVADGGWVVRALLKLEGTAPEAVERPPLNLCLVLDRSGSMAGAKLEAARDAAVLVARRLAPDDVVSVVAFDDTVRTIARAAPRKAHPDLPQRIAEIECGGSTNLSGGWLRGRELVAEHARPNRIDRVLLLTDGQANVGITDPGQLLGLCGSAAAQGIATTTIGFGEDYDEVLLRGMADAGRGNSYYIELPDQAPAVFARELEGLLSLAAQNVSVTVRPATGSLATLWHSYPATETPEGGLRLELGDLYAFEPKPLLAEFLVDEGRGEVDVAELVVRATVLGAGGAVEAVETVLPIRVSLAQGAHANPEVRRELVLLQAARARQEALRARERGDAAVAAEALRGAAFRLEDLGVGYDDGGAVLEEIEDLRMMAESFDDGRVSEADAKYLFQTAMDSARGARSRSGIIRRRRGEA